VKPAYNETARNGSSFPVAGSFRLVHVLELWIFGAVKFFPLKPGFPYAQFSLEISLNNNNNNNVSRNKKQA
jgi:hypothetical protein